PLTVVVIGATVTLVIAARAASRVKMRAGRVLSRWIRQISRTRSALDAGVGGGPREEVVEVICITVGSQDLHVLLGGESSHLSFHCGRNERGPARDLAGSDAVVEKRNHFIGQADGDLSAHVIQPTAANPT